MAANPDKYMWLMMSDCKQKDWSERESQNQTRHCLKLDKKRSKLKLLPSNFAPLCIFFLIIYRLTFLRTIVLNERKCRSRKIFVPYTKPLTVHEKGIY